MKKKLHSGIILILQILWKTREWFHFETPSKRAIRVAILPEIAEELLKRARAQGISVETLVNVILWSTLRRS
jgi:hypothetical protein